MNAESTSIASPLGADSPLTAGEVDRSCQFPLLFLFGKSLGWLFIGTALLLLSAIKLHAPNLLSHTAWLTYGRIQPAAYNALAYGFAAQAALAITLWLLARLGRTRLELPFLASVGAFFWNLGVAIGVIGILAGAGTGYPWFEMPGFTFPFLFVAYLAIGIAGVVTFHMRREPELYVSQWYLLAALFCFPWIYSVAYWLLIATPVRGALQAAVNGWFAHNLFELFLIPVGLAAIYYFVPKLLARPLYSRYLAAFGFWILMLFGSIGGVAAWVPLPRWLSALSTVAGVLNLVGVLAVTTNLYLTLKAPNGAREANRDPVLKLTVFAALCYVLAEILRALGGLPEVARVTAFTFYSTAITHLFLYGFIGSAVLAGVFYIAPLITRVEWPSHSALRLVLWISVFGTILAALPLLAGGVVLGSGINNAATPYITVARSTIPFVGTATLGITLLLFGQVLLLAQFTKICLAWARTCCPLDWRSEVAPNPSPAAAGVRL